MAVYNFKYCSFINKYIFILLLFLNFAIKPGLVNLKILRHNQNHIIFLSDNHAINPLEETKTQISALKELAITIDDEFEKSKDKAVFFLEVPFFMSGLLCSKLEFIENAKPALEQIKKELLLYNIFIKDIETRNVSGAAITILNYDPKSTFSKFNWVSAGKSCQFKEIKFDELLNEFSNILASVKILNQKNIKKVSDLFEIEIKKAQEAIIEFKQFLHNKNIEDNDGILDISNKLFHDNPSLRNQLKDRILSVANQLFNLCLLQNITNNLNKYKIMVIVSGGFHCRETSSELKQLDFEEVLNLGDFKKPIDRHQLDTLIRSIRKSA